MQDQYEDDYDDTASDLWNDAALAAMYGKPCPADDDNSKAGYAYGLEERKVRVVMPARPEGYYHMPLETE